MASLTLGHDPEFAGQMDAIATQALRDGDTELADYMMDAADCWAPPDEGTHVMRMAALSAAVGRLSAKES